MNMKENLPDPHTMHIVEPIEGIQHKCICQAIVLCKDFEPKWW